jgi:hypothetical protein
VLPAVRYWSKVILRVFVSKPCGRSLNFNLLVVSHSYCLDSVWDAIVNSLSPLSRFRMVKTIKVDKALTLEVALREGIEDE